jgi:beta-xylosidase
MCLGQLIAHAGAVDKEWRAANPRRLSGPSLPHLRRLHSQYEFSAGESYHIKYDSPFEPDLTRSAVPGIQLATSEDLFNWTVQSGLFLAVRNDSFDNALVEVRLATRLNNTRSYVLSLRYRLSG